MIHEDSPEFPNFSAVLNVGKTLSFWGTNSSIEGTYLHSENTVRYISEGKVTVQLHTNGICIQRGLSYHYISDQQIVNICASNQSEILKENKSVIGRAMVGGLILGPAAAIIGGLSGLGSTQRAVEKYYLIINFWDVKTRLLQTLLINTGEASMNSGMMKGFEREKLNKFIDRYCSNKSEKHFPEGKNNLVFNILNDDLSLNEDHIIEAINEVGISAVYHYIATLYQENGATFVQQQIKVVKDIATKKGLIKEKTKTAGCMVVFATLGIVFMMFFML